ACAKPADLSEAVPGGGAEVPELVRRDDAADGRDADGPGVVAEHEPVGSERGVDPRERGTGTSLDETPVDVDADGVEATQIDDDRRPEHGGPTHEPAAAAASHQRD